MALGGGNRHFGGRERLVDGRGKVLPFKRSHTAGEVSQWLKRLPLRHEDVDLIPAATEDEQLGF